MGRIICYRGASGIRYDAAAVTYNNKLIVSGGANSPQSNTWELNLDTKVWSENIINFYYSRLC